MNMQIHEIDDFEYLDKEMLAKANISPKTGFATDYLNVFNEAIMLFGLLGDMPEMIEELVIWEALSYEEHFRRSNFHAKDLAIAVYRLIPSSRKAPFDEMSIELGHMVHDAIKDAEKIINNGGDLQDFCTETCFALQSVAMMLDGMIHGRAAESAQSDVDAMFKKQKAAKKIAPIDEFDSLFDEIDVSEISQDDIDALFD
jgi:hypothetical protein